MNLVNIAPSLPGEGILDTQDISCRRIAKVMMASYRGVLWVDATIIALVLFRVKLITSLKTQPYHKHMSLNITVREPTTLFITHARGTIYNFHMQKSVWQESNSVYIR